MVDIRVFVSKLMVIHMRNSAFSILEKVLNLMLTPLCYNWYILLHRVTKKELNCYEIPTPLDIIQAISLGIKLDKEDLHMYIVYRSPNSSPENNSKINNFINSVKDNSVIVGDFNYPDINWELLTGTLHTQEFLDVLSEKHLNQHVTFPTHQAGNILDLVFSNVPNLFRINFFFFYLFCNIYK